MTFQMTLPAIPAHVLVKFGVYLAVVLVAHWPSNWLIRKIIKRWKPDEEDLQDNMGAFIGTLERVLTILLVGLGALTAVGLVVTMKSIARYDKLRTEKPFAEYFLAGTMLSMLLGLILGLIAQRSVGAI
ncbi:MAG: hypothetical protein ACE5IY_01255 [bacterium]